METVDYLIVGAGVTGLSFANFLESDRYLILEKNNEAGGYCRSVRRQGFTWDYAGHFFHFRNSDIAAFLLERFPKAGVVWATKRAAVHLQGRLIDHPFQRHIHQLARDDFINCLRHLLVKEVAPSASGLKGFLYQSCGKAIAELFLIPYTEKLFATDVSQLNSNSLGRFFPKATFAELLCPPERFEDGAYNAQFMYPVGGASQLIDVLLAGLPSHKVAYRERLCRVDTDSHIATTNKRSIRYRHLISSAPFLSMLQYLGEGKAAQLLTSSKVLAFNLGFDRKGDTRYHWIYFPEARYAFYRVGYYDNVLAADRMSLYVETAFHNTARVNVETVFGAVMDGLQQVGIVTEQKLIARHHVVMDPAYVHNTPTSAELLARYDTEWRARDVYTVGRYGGWRYSSIEDDILEARSLASSFGG